MFSRFCSLQSKFLRMSTDTNKRIVLYLKKSSSEEDPIPATFTQSIMNYFGLDEHHEGYLSAELVNNKVILSDSDSNTSAKIMRPPYCPINNLRPNDVNKLPVEIKNRGVDVCVVVILHTGDNKILLTRRSNDLGTFPGAWVPPGGHIEENETIVQAGLRELKEETGLKITLSDLVGKKAPILAFWESTFPVKLTHGLPKRHHLVIYILAKLEPDVTSERLQKHISLEPDEVGASVWLDRQMVEAITMTTEQNMADCQLHKHVPSEIQATVVRNEKQEITVIPSAPLLDATSTDIPDLTKFILEEWLKTTSNDEQRDSMKY